MFIINTSVKLIPYSVKHNHIVFNNVYYMISYDEQFDMLESVLIITKTGSYLLTSELLRLTQIIHYVKLIKSVEYVKRYKTIVVNYDSHYSVSDQTIIMGSSVYVRIKQCIIRIQLKEKNNHIIRVNYRY